jgi:hypothetical protein
MGKALFAPNGVTLYRLFSLPHYSTAQECSRGELSQVLLGIPPVTARYRPMVDPNGPCRSDASWAALTPVLMMSLFSNLPIRPVLMRVKA